MKKCRSGREFKPVPHLLPPANVMAVGEARRQVGQSDLAVQARPGADAPRNGRGASLLQMQRHLGNRYVQRYVQGVLATRGAAEHSKRIGTVGLKRPLPSRALAGGSRVPQTRAADVQRQSVPGTQAQAQAPAADWRIGAHAFNLILQRDFAVANNSWYSGTRSDLPPGGAVRADLATGRAGRVQFALSPDFAPAGRSAAETAIDPARVAAVRVEVIRLFDWRLAQGLLTAEDITAPFVSARLRAMAPLALRALRARPTIDPGAQAELDRILAITTQLPATAQFDATGAASLTINGINVRILPDTRQGTRNETSFRFVPAQLQTPGFSHRGGRVTAITGPVPTAPTVEIFTSYASQGAQASADPLTAISAYGRGTTAGDTAGGTTSLRFHESRHGEDFLQYITSHPFPTYTGRVGMTVSQFTQAGATFLAAFANWSRDMGRASVCATDCVGSPNIDVFEHNVGAHMKCTTCHP